MKQNKVLLVTIGVFVAGLILLQAKLQNANTDFLGIAESRESQVNFEYPVEIKRIHVIPGQNVNKGDLLVELDQSGLATQIRNIKTQITKLEAQQKLVRDVSVLISPTSKSTSHEESVSESDPSAVELNELRKELAIVESNKKNLLVFAQVDGVVGAVNFRKGEKVPAFSALISISPHHPTYIQAFVHENLNLEMQVGQTVKVRSAVNKKNEILAKVVSVGSRIIPVPPRLLRIASIQTYGREVIIALPSENAFLHGEKVEIDASRPWFSFMSRALAEADTELGPKKLEALEMNVPHTLYDQTAVEPSGLVWIPDLSKFLMISDDTNSGHEPFLFLINEDGHVDEDFLKVEGLAKMADIESISADTEGLYLMSSSSLSSDGERKEPRELFVRVKREGMNLKHEKSAPFGELFRSALSHSADPELQAVLENIKIQETKNSVKKGLDIESHFVVGKDLYIGLKTPSIAKEALVIKISDFSSLFDKYLSSEQISIFKKLDLSSAIVGHRMRISDMLLVGDMLYLSSSCENIRCSALWRTKFDEKIKAEPELIWFFDKFQLEGISYTPETKTIWGVFDEGKSNPKYLKYNLENANPQ